MVRDRKFDEDEGVGERVEVVGRVVIGDELCFRNTGRIDMG